MKRFLVLMYGGLYPEKAKQESLNEHFQKWGAYLAYFNQNSHLISGSPLNQKGLVMTQNGSFEMEDQTYLEGYMLIEAKSLQAVEAMLKDCPSLDFKTNKLEIRALNPGLQ